MNPMGPLVAPVRCGTSTGASERKPRLPADLFKPKESLSQTFLADPRLRCEMDKARGSSKEDIQGLRVQILKVPTQRPKPLGLIRSMKGYKIGGSKHPKPQTLGTFFVHVSRLFSLFPERQLSQPIRQRPVLEWTIGDCFRCC